MTKLTDPVALAQALIRCPSITPNHAGTLDLVQNWLTELNFHCLRLPHAEVDNLYARSGNGSDNLLFLGHVDVVPPGDTHAWSVNPFAADISNNTLTGRGAVDMKGGVAAWIAALARAGCPTNRTLSVLLTSDEEGPALNGVRRALPDLAARGETFASCLVGEPTSEKHLADCIKTGRRGSLNCTITASGIQGHVAYPHHAANPVSALTDFLGQVKGDIDHGCKLFQPSRVEITSVDVGNNTTNLIPATASARLNVRFRPPHDCNGIESMLRDTAHSFSQNNVTLNVTCNKGSEAFMSTHGKLCDLVTTSVENATGRTPAITTSGGTSDARFVHHYCPVVELGPKNATAHAIDESMPLADLHLLTTIYHSIITKYHASSSA